MTPEEFYSDAGVAGCQTPEEFGQIIHRRYRNTWPRYPAADPGRYQHNSLGFRGGEFDPAAKINYYGCSVTYGQGVALEQRWTALVDQALGHPGNNFALPALSTEAIGDIFLATTRFFRPEQAVIMLPPPGRVSLPVKLDGVSIWHWCPGTDIKSLPRTIQDTVRSWVTLPQDYYYDAQRAAIDRIELVAQIKGINTVYSSWDYATHQYLHGRGLRVTEQFCNGDQLGSDSNHPGAAAHQRFAEAFLAVIARAWQT